MVLLQLLLIALFAYGCYYVFFRSRFDPDFDDEEVIMTKRCTNCGCVNMKKAKRCKNCGVEI